ncbi:unnamed protein product, partial [Closterium sp. NIES-54]
SAAAAGVPTAQYRLDQLHLRRCRLRRLHPNRHRHRRPSREYSGAVGSSKYSPCVPRSPDPHDQEHGCRTRGRWR